VARRPQSRYLDPADQIWIACARKLGLEVHRTRDAFAHTDGRASLAIATADLLDEDDCLAQMIFHEICHSLVEGPEAFERPDWGLDNTGPKDAFREHACLRVQAVLAARHGLRVVLAPTTDFRDFYDKLPDNPIADRNRESVRLAIAALRRAARPPWAPHLDRALVATANIARASADFDADSKGELASLWTRVDEEPAPHPTGLESGIAAGESCSGCAWRYQGGPGKLVDRCRQAEGKRIDPSWSACERWEAALDCQTCGACCRAAYDSVTIPRRSPVIRSHPELVVDRGSYVELRRDKDRCVGLEGGISETAGSGDLSYSEYSCKIYEERPKPCRDFELGGEHCLTARRRVALSI